MSYEAFNTGSSVVVAWDRPAIEDVNAVVALVQSAHVPARGDLAYVAYIPDGMKAPEGPVRAAMVRSISRILERCAHMHFVIEGSGFGPSVGRSVMAGIILAAGHRGRIHIYSSVDEAAAYLPGDAVTRLRSLQVRDAAS